jgi:[ribosomal protein S18]-alanine N-acetyltransferase
MSALPQPPHQLTLMSPGCIDAVLAIEQRAYAFPWTRGNFIDSLAAGYSAEVLSHTPHKLVGYFVAMPGVDEMHLLNLTVAPEFQAQGHARTLFNALLARCHIAALGKLWLEVRQSNTHAQAIYRHFGFSHIGLRKAYYPASSGPREDAAVMALELNLGAP